MWKKVERSWFAAYEFLHIAAYWLIGKEHRYAFGSAAGQAEEALTRSQRLFCLLFPLLTIVVAMLLLASVWVYTYVHFLSHIAPRTYYFSAPAWHIGLQMLILVLPIFAAPAYFDLHQITRLLREPPHQPPEQAPTQPHERKYPQ